MSSINYSNKARCQGCAALQSGNKDFSCLFGLPLRCEEGEGGQKLQPSPDGVKCYKPKTPADLRQAKLLMEQKWEKEKNNA